MDFCRLRSCGIGHRMAKKEPWAMANLKNKNALANKRNQFIKKVLVHVETIIFVFQLVSFMSQITRAYACHDLFQNSITWPPQSS